MRKTKSAGILLFTKKKTHFLLMRHDDRWDLPKGHVEEGESDIAAAIREFEEETGVSRSSIKLIEDFKFELHYIAKEKKYQEFCDKTLIIYLATLKSKNFIDTEIKLTEHKGHSWFIWNPPHKIQHKTIDPLLFYTYDYFKQKNLKKILKLSKELGNETISGI